MTLAEAAPFPPAPGPALGKAIMDERKRPSVSDPDDTAPPAKKHAPTVNGSKSQADADLPWKDDIDVRPISESAHKRLTTSLKQLYSASY